MSLATCSRLGGRAACVADDCCLWDPERPGRCARSHRREDPIAYLVWAGPGSPRPTGAGARGPARPTLMRALAESSSNPNLPQFPAPAMSEFTYAPEFTRGTIEGRTRSSMSTIESVGSHVER